MPGSGTRSPGSPIAFRSSARAGRRRIDVINQCTKADGSPDRAEGVARIVDPASNAKLQVSFVSFLGWRPFWGDYWIIGLDEDYR